VHYELLGVFCLDLDLFFFFFFKVSCSLVGCFFFLKKNEKKIDVRYHFKWNNFILHKNPEWGLISFHNC